MRRTVALASALLLSAAFPARAFSPGLLPLRGMSGSPATSPRGVGGARLGSVPGRSQLLPARGARTGGKYGSLQMQQQVDEKAEASKPLLAADGEKAANKEEEAQALTPAVWGVLALLLAANVHNQWTRALVYYIVSFKVEATEITRHLYMNIDLGFDETQYSLLASFGFTTFFTLCSLIAGRAADRTDRASIVSIAAVAWSLATLGQGVATTFDWVLGGRALTGAAQAFLTPAAFGLIADRVPNSRLSTANAFYSSGVYLGGALASLSILLDNSLGWRDTSLLCGGIGPLPPAQPTVKPTAALAMPGGKELGDVGEEGGEESGGMMEQGQQALAAIGTVLDSRFVKLLFVASAFRFCAGYGIGVWKAPFFREAFPTYLEQFSVANAFVISGGGVLSSIIGGALADKFAVNDERVRLWIPAAGCVLAVPLWYAFCQSTDFTTSIAILFAEYIVAECWFGNTPVS
ncbi:major facilitator superfamily domain-containing protein [Baffinella frigidus]|nr:major facilitator superfamily domain-containing protein [Cryptophyta sp. CCMP2293]